LIFRWADTPTQAEYKIARESLLNAANINYYYAHHSTVEIFLVNCELAKIYKV
jgi:hypothetical protein